MVVMQQADNTANAIRKKVRRLTSSPSTSQLSNDDLDKAINTFYNNDFPYAIKLDQMRSVYTLFTSPNIDRYPLNVNYNQGIRDPVYFEGIRGYFFKERDQFFNMWPRWPSLFTPETGDGITQIFSFTIPGPFLSQNVVLGATDTSGNTIRVGDDGNGNLQYELSNVQIAVPPEIPFVPGMHNFNTGNPGDVVKTNIGTVNYVTGLFNLDFSLVGITPASGSQFNLWVSQYSSGRPYTILFWNNEFTIRPVPDKVYKVELESYLTPIQLLDTDWFPILNQWWQYIAFGTSMEILRERQDLEGVENLREGFMRQEALVLERQSIEEIGQRNVTIFSQTVQNQNFGNPQGWFP